MIEDAAGMVTAFYSHTANAGTKCALSHSDGSNNKSYQNTPLKRESEGNV